MAPKKRLPENKGLPERWRWKDGAYRYRVPAGLERLWDGKKEFKLGATKAEAYRVYAERVKEYERGGLVYMRQVFDKYEIEVLHEKAASTQKSNRYSIERLRKAFGDSKIAAIRPVHIYQYRDYIAKHLSEKHYNLDHEVLSHVFTKCIEWGAVDVHPMTDKKVVKFTVKRRSRYVTDSELAAFLSVAPPMIQAYVTLKGLLALDKGDMLSIRVSGIGDDGLTVAARKKTAKKRGNRERFFPYFIEADEGLIDTGLKAAIDNVLELPRPIGSMFLFCTKRGQPYIKEGGLTSGFDSIWQRAMKKALAQTSLAEKFTEHDLRAKVASDAETDQEAQRQLDHATVQTTRSTYRRKAQVMPVAKGFKNE